MTKFFKRNRKDTKTYEITYIDGIDVMTEVVDSKAYSNFISSLDCCGCEIVEVKEIKG